MKLYETQNGKPAARPAGNIQKKKGKRKKKAGFVKRFLLTLLIMLLILVGGGTFLMYGPISYFRDMWVTTAMTTLHHQWLATMFFDKKTIAAILADNRTDENGDQSNAGDISVLDGNVKDNATTLPTSPSDGEHIIDGIGFTRLQTATYDGWVIRVFDPSRIYMALAENYGVTGEQVSHMTKRLDAFVGINAGGFIDVNGHGNGGKADKVLISQGSLVSRGGYSTEHHIIGFDKQGRLLLTLWNQSAVGSLTGLYRDAVEFSPFLIVNGKPTEMYGNGGYGIQPRTAIGQTKDGTVIFVQIDGRRPPNVIGASVRDLQNIFIQYHAYNAANLDGGSSSVFVYKNQVINTPSSYDGERYVPDAFMIQYK
jgi:Exopolysaccharide biosynthesis protein related to N-acetylglucosamine-1-phosphodiester alpha-N-acetylglucosaminidase